MYGVLILLLLMGNHGFQKESPLPCSCTDRCRNEIICGHIIHNIQGIIKGKIRAGHLIHASPGPLEDAARQDGIR